jgi:hypothetical protein
MKKFLNYQRLRGKYRFDIADHKKALKIWADSTFNQCFGSASVFYANLDPT